MLIAVALLGHVTALEVRPVLEELTRAQRRRATYVRVPDGWLRSGSSHCSASLPALFPLTGRRRLERSKPDALSRPVRADASLSPSPTAALVRPLPGTPARLRPLLHPRRYRQCRAAVPLLLSSRSPLLRVLTRAPVPPPARHARRPLTPCGPRERLARRSPSRWPNPDTRADDQASPRCVERAGRKTPVPGAVRATGTSLIAALARAERRRRPNCSPTSTPPADSSSTCRCRRSVAAGAATRTTWSGRSATMVRSRWASTAPDTAPSRPATRRRALRCSRWCRRKPISRVPGRRRLQRLRGQCEPTDGGTAAACRPRQSRPAQAPGLYLMQSHFGESLRELAQGKAGIRIPRVRDG